MPDFARRLPEKASTAHITKQANRNRILVPTAPMGISIDHREISDAFFTPLTSLLMTEHFQLLPLPTMPPHKCRAYHLPVRERIDQERKGRQ